MAKLRKIPKGSTVRIVNHGTPSQRRVLWINDEEIVGDWGYTLIHRQEDPDCMIQAPTHWLEEASVLDLLVSE